MTKNQLKNTLLKARDVFLNNPHERCLLKVWSKMHRIDLVAIYVGRRVTFVVRVYPPDGACGNTEIPFTSLVAAEKNFRDTYLGL